MSSLRCVGFVLIVLFATGCSRTDILYSNADWLAYRWADALMDAGDDQEQAWRGLFRDTMSEHRRQLLPEIVRMLQMLEAGVRRGVKAAELTCWNVMLDRLYRDHARWAAVPAAEVLGGISARQVDHLAAELERRNREYAEDYLVVNLQQRQDNRVERYIDRIENWTGELDTAQLRVVEQVIRSLPDTAADWLQYRRLKQQQLLDRLRGGATADGLRRFIEAWWADLADRPPGLIRQTNAVQAGFSDLLLTLDRMLTKAQRDELLDRLADLRTGLQAAMVQEQPVVLAQGGGVDCVGPGQANN